MSTIRVHSLGNPWREARRQWSAPFPLWWLSLPAQSTPMHFSLKQRLFGPMHSHTGKRLGFLGRWLYGWFYTDDPYFDRVDAELTFKGI